MRLSKSDKKICEWWASRLGRAVYYRKVRGCDFIRFYRPAEWRDGVLYSGYQELSVVPFDNILDDYWTWKEWEVSHEPDM